MAGIESFVVAVEGLDALEQLTISEAKRYKAAVMAINAAARKARTWGADGIQSEVNLPRRYLINGDDGNLAIKKYATDASFTAIVEGRARPTSLARYATRRVAGRLKAGEKLELQVKPNHATYMRRAFIINLRQGDSGALGNLGLAYRVKPGDTLQKSRGAVKLSKSNPKFGDLYLLYGPSVDQVFRKVAEDIKPRVESYLASEFSRLISVELK